MSVSKPHSSELFEEVRFYIDRALKADYPLTHYAQAMKALEGIEEQLEALHWWLDVMPAPIYPEGSALWKSWALNGQRIRDSFPASSPPYPMPYGTGGNVAEQFPATGLYTGPIEVTFKDNYGNVIDKRYVTGEQNQDRNPSDG